MSFFRIVPKPFVCVTFSNKALMVVVLIILNMDSISLLSIYSIHEVINMLCFQKKKKSQYQDDKYQVLAVPFERNVSFGRVINGASFIRQYIAIHLPSLSCVLHFIILLLLLLRSNYEQKFPADSEQDGQPRNVGVAESAKREGQN